MSKLYRSWDPLYGKISFSDYEFGLISLPEVQRLRYVRMCNINSLLITGASEISRFEHTLGVLRLTQEWCSHASAPRSTKKDILAAAVLHDMKTGPFGHSLQYVLEDNEREEEFKHDDISHQKSNFHQSILAKRGFKGRLFSSEKYLGERWDSVSELINGKSKYGPVIAGTMDLDNIDNVVRLAYHAGVATKEDSELALSLARNMSVTESGQLSFPESSISEIERWLIIRRDLYRLLLLDWAEFSAKAMLTRAVEIAIEHGRIDADSWIYTDLEFLYWLERACVGGAQEAGVLVKRIQLGDLYSPVVLLKSSSVSYYKKLSEYLEKKEFEKNLSLVIEEKFRKKIRPIFHLILDSGKTERQITFFSPESGGNVAVGNNSKALLLGIFIPDDSLSERVLKGVREEILSMLKKIGLEDVESIQDPVEPSSDGIADLQLGLGL